MIDEEKASALEEIDVLLTQIREADSSFHAQELLAEFILKTKESEAMTSQNLVEDLAKERQRQQVSQKELAARLATKQPALARMERGHRDPKLSTLEAYVSALGKRLTWVIEDA